MKIPILDLGRSFKEIRSEADEAVKRIFDSQSFILGSEVSNFEKHCENYLELPENSCVSCASGTDALLLALMAADVKSGDEIITTPFTFFATAGAAARLGAVPVFCDIEPETYNINLNDVLKKVTSKTKVFLPVHLFGQMVALENIIDELKSRNVKVIEDSAQSFGAVRFVNEKINRAGTVGDIGCYSFFPTKNLGGCGDGGMVVSKNPKISERLKSLRVHGSGKTYFHDEIGINSRLDAIQAAILDIKLKHLDDWNSQRRKIADYYKELFEANELLDFVTPPAELKGNFHIYHQYAVRVKNKRDDLMKYLEENGVPTRIYYPLSLHLQPCFKYLGYKEGDCPESEKLTREILAFPIYPGLQKSEQEFIVETIAKFFKK